MRLQILFHEVCIQELVESRKLYGGMPVQVAEVVQCLVKMGKIDAAAQLFAVLAAAHPSAAADAQLGLVSQVTPIARH